MATTKNKKKKKSRRYLTRAARRTVAALLMISALIVAAIPATPSRAAEDSIGDEEAAGENGITHDTETVIYTFTADLNETQPINLTLTNIKKSANYTKAVTELTLDNIKFEYPKGSGNYYDGKFTKIGSGAIKDSSEINSELNVLHAPNVTTIESNAFENCTALQSFDGTNVKEIQSSAFLKCSGLKDCYLSKSVDSIGNNAFSYCTSLAKLPKTDHITTLGNSVFAFSGLTSGTQEDDMMEIPGPIDGSQSPSVGYSVFEGCTELKGVKFTGNYASIGVDLFKDCGSNLETVVLPEGITSIPDSTFSGCTGLAYITIPSGVSQLPDGLFADSEASLKEITLNNDDTGSDTIIASGLPNNLNLDFHVKGYRKRNGAGALNPGYTQAYQYCLKNDIMYICLDDDGGVADQFFDVDGSNNIVNCDLTNYWNEQQTVNNRVDIPTKVAGKEVTGISATAFGEEALNVGDITKIYVSGNILNIESGAFSKLGNLKYVYFSDKSDVTISGENVFPSTDNFKYVFGPIKGDSKETTNQYEYAMENDIQYRGSGKYDGGDITLVVEDYALIGAVAANIEDATPETSTPAKTLGVTSINLPEGIKTINAGLFKEDTGLEKIKMDGVVSLADDQFQASSVQSVEMSASLEYMGELPFESCTDLKKVSFGENSLFSIDKNGVITGPDQPGDDGNSCIIEAVEKYTNGNFEYELKPDIYSIRKGAFKSNRNITSFKSDIIDGNSSPVYKIPDNCFYGSTLQKITIGKGLTNIGSGAFCNLFGVNEFQSIVYQNPVRYDDGGDSYDVRNTNSTSSKNISNIAASDVLYYFWGTAADTTDSTYILCNPGGKENSDNLIWKGLSSEKKSNLKSLSSCKIYYNGNKSSDGSYGIRKYTGSDISWVPGNLTSGDFYVVDGDTILSSGTHYNLQTITPSPPNAKRSYSFVLNGIRDYGDVLTGTFVINDSGSEEGGDTPTPTPDTGDFIIDLHYDGPGLFKWTGEMIRPKAYVYDRSTGAGPLTENVDYVLSYGDTEGCDNKSMGPNRGLVTVTGKGDTYAKKSGSQSFSIKKSLSENIVGNPTPPGKTIDVTISNGVYDSNNAVSANIVLIDRTTGKTLTEGVDYTVTCTKISGKNQAIATITGMGDYYYDTYVSSRFAITKKKSSSSGSTSSSSGTASSSSSSSGSSSSSSGSSSSSSSGSSSSSSSAGSSSAGGNYSRNTTSGSTVTRTSGGTVRAATDDELANLLQAAHIDAINGGTADGYQVRISKTDSAESAFSQALVNRYGSLDNVRYYSMDIELLDENGNYVDSSGVTVTMTLPLPDSLASYGANNRVATVDGSGNLEDLGVTYSMLQGRECATFVAPHFSPYGFYVDVANLDYGVMDSTPKTGDPISPKWFFSLGLAALSIFLFLKKDPKPKANPA